MISHLCVIVSKSNRRTQKSQSHTPWGDWYLWHKRLIFNTRNHSLPLWSEFPNYYKYNHLNSWNFHPNNTSFLTIPMTTIFAYWIEIEKEWVMQSRPFWIKNLAYIPHIMNDSNGRFGDKKEWRLLSVLYSLWGIYHKIYAIISLLLLYWILTKKSNISFNIVGNLTSF